MNSKIILGIDPGTTIMGYGIIKVTGENVSLIDFNDFSLKKLDNHYLKLKKIFSSLTEIIDKYNHRNREQEDIGYPWLVANRY